MTALAQALAVQAVRTFRTVPEGDRGPCLAAIDGFLAAPAPSSFLAAVRALDQARQRALVDHTASTTVARGRTHGLDALRAVPGFPPRLVDRLQSLPADPRSSVRLAALTSLVTAYQELALRVAADTMETRRRLRSTLPRRGGRPRS